MSNIISIEEYKHHQLYSSVKTFYDNPNYSITIKESIIKAYKNYLESFPKNKKIIKDLISLVEEELIIE